MELQEDWEAADTGRDALLILIDAQEKMFHLREDGQTWFNNCIEMAIAVLKNKIIAADSAMIGIILFGTGASKNSSSLDNLYDLLDLGYPDADRIKSLQKIVRGETNIQQELQVTNSSKCNLSDALWHSGVVFSNAKLKQKDTQRIWIFTNADQGPSDEKEKEQATQQAQDHAELHREILFYFMPPPEGKFDLSIFYDQMFQSVETSSICGIESPEEMLQTMLRRQYRKRKSTTVPLTISDSVEIGVEVYAMTIVQTSGQNTIFVEAATNTPLKSETKWLDANSGVYLAPDDVKTYVEYGGERVYISRDDMLEIKDIGQKPGIQILCFQHISELQPYETVRSSYFLYPCEEFITGSKEAFVAILNAMQYQNVMAIARMMLKRNSEPRLVALLPQSESYDKFGQKQATGLNVIFLPFADDIRNPHVDKQEHADYCQVESAKSLIRVLTLDEVPLMDNPVLQKHYASVQALALDEYMDRSEVEDCTLPDEEFLASGHLEELLSKFHSICDCNALDEEDVKRKANRKDSGTHIAKKKVKKEPEMSVDISEWKEILALGQLQKQTVAQLKGFLRAQGKPATGKKADLLAAVSLILKD